MGRDRCPTGAHGHSLMYGLGWLSSVTSFERLKNNLKHARLVNDRLENVMSDSEPCKLSGGSKSVLFTMDMIDDGRFREFDDLKKVRTCGQPLLWLGSHEPSLSTLCVRVEQNWAFSPCGLWDSNDSVIHNKTIRALSGELRGVERNP